MAKEKQDNRWAVKRGKPSATASDCFARIVLIFRFYLSWSGFDFFIPKFKTNILTWTTFIMTGSGQPILIYTMISRSRETMMRACSIFGLMMQGCMKAYTTFYYRHRINNNLHYLRTVYERNTGKSNGNEEILLRWAKIFLLFTRVLSTAITFMFPVICVYPLITSGTYFDPNEPLLPVFLPYVDEYTRWGMYTSLFGQFICLFLGTVGILGCDLLFMNQVNAFKLSIMAYN